MSLNSHSSNFSASESQSTDLSIRQLFDQLLKRTGIDEQMNENKARNEKNIQEIHKIEQKFDSHIQAIDERINYYE